jgi:hypothetical protein
LLASTTYLGVVCLVLQQPFSGFSNMGWFIYSSGSLPIDGLVIGKFCNPTHACRVSLSLLSQAVITSILAWLFLDEEKLQLICYWWFNLSESESLFTRIHFG